MHGRATIQSGQHVSAFFVRWEWYYAGVGFFGRSEDGDWEANLSARISGLRLAYGWTFSSGSGSRATSGLAGIIKFKREDVIFPQCGVSTAEDEPGASTGARSWYSDMPAWNSSAKGPSNLFPARAGGGFAVQTASRTCELDATKAERCNQPRLGLLGQVRRVPLNIFS